MAEQYEDQSFVEFVVRALVNNSDAVEVDRTVDERGVLLTVKVDPSDMSHLIGRQGGTARALRTLLRTVGAKNNSRVNLKIHEPEGSTHYARRQEESVAPANDDLDTSAVDSLSI